MNIQILAFSPDGQTLAGGGDVDHLVHLWETDSGKELPPLRGLSNIIRTLAFSEDGKLLAAGSVTRINREMVIAGKTVQVGSLQEEIRLWELATGAEKLKINGKERASLKAIQLRAGDKTLLSVNDKGDLILWDIGSGRAVASSTIQTGITAAAVTADGKIVAAGDNDGIVTLWEAAGGRQLGKLIGPKNRVASLAFSQDGKFLAVGTDQGMKPVEVRVWEVATERARGVLQGATGAITAVVFGPDGKTLVTGGWDKKVRVWDIGAALH
jgi:tricorn protease-like protein